MSRTFRALRVHGDGDADARIERLTLDQLPPGEVTIDVHYSGLNFKDALAVTGRGKILRHRPLIAGIDAAGVVTASAHPDYRPGDQVIVGGGGVGESLNGGFAEVMRLSADHLTKLPDGLTPREAMILGTAGFTAALALHRLSHHGLASGAEPIAVTGATGGVGSFATQIFARAGFAVTAISGKPELFDYLRDLGATQACTPEALALGERPLERARFAGAVDTVGGELLARLLAHVRPWGGVAAIGLADAAELSTTVMPFILRGVSLLGISSSNAPRSVRAQIWPRLAGPWRPRLLEECVTRVIDLPEIPRASVDMLERRTHGRVLVEFKASS